MAKEVVRLPGMSEALEAARVPLSAAIKANGFVFVSGLPPLDRSTGEIVSGSMGEQTELVLENVKAVLEEAGSSLEKVVKVNVFVSNSAYFPTVNEVYARYFPHDPPARTFVAVGSWPFEFDIEIECTALA